MTINEAFGYLIAHFLNSNCLLQSDIEALSSSISASTNVEVNSVKIALIAAAEEFTKENFLKKVETKNNKNIESSYVLYKSIRSLPQNIVITLQTAGELAELLNTALKTANITDRTVNILNIQECDIQTLIRMYASLVENLKIDSSK